MRGRHVMVSARRRIGCVLLCLSLLAGALTGCASRNTNPKVITYWTTITDPITMKAWNEIIAGFEKANPGYTVNLLPKPTIGTGDATDLITAVRGHTGPDVYLVDRFTTAQYAATGILTDLQPYVNQTPGMSSKFLKFAWDEGSYRGHAYGIPNDSDSRALFYNKTLLRKAGINPDILSPTHGPPTVSEVLKLNSKLNKTKNGAYTQIGLIPWVTQGFWSTWTLENGATFFDNKTCSLDLLSKPIINAFSEEAAWAKQLNYAKVAAFIATYQPAGAPPNQSIFLDGKEAMSIDGNFNIAPLQQYKPNLDYGVTYLPVLKKGDPPFTWSGGFAYVIPKYASNADGGWKFIKYASGPEGQKIYATVTKHLPTYKALLNDPAVTKDQKFFADALKYSTSRPPLPINAQLQNAMTNAETAVLSGAATPRAALQSVEQQTESNLKQYCPFTIPKPPTANR